MVPSTPNRSRRTWQFVKLASALGAAVVTSATAVAAACAPPPPGGSGWLPPASPPKAPSNVRLTGGSCNHMRIEWNDNSTNETGFEIRYEIAGWNNWATIRVGANVRAVDIPITQCVECTRNIKVRAVGYSILYGTLYSAYSSTLNAGVSLYCLW